MQSEYSKYQVNLKGITVEDATVGAIHRFVDCLCSVTYVNFRNVLTTEIGNRNLMLDCSLEQYLKPNKTATEPDSKVTVSIQCSFPQFIVHDRFVSLKSNAFTLLYGLPE